MHHQSNVPCSGETNEQPGKASRGQFLILNLLILNLLIALVLTIFSASGHLAVAATKHPGNTARLQLLAGAEQVAGGAMTRVNLSTHRNFAPVLAEYRDLSALDPDNDHPLLGVLKGGSRMLTSIIAIRCNTPQYGSSSGEHIRHHDYRYTLTLVGE